MAVEASKNVFEIKVDMAMLMLKCPYTEKMSKSLSRNKANKKPQIQLNFNLLKHPTGISSLMYLAKCRHRITPVEH